MLDSWLPFLIYAILALLIPASMLGMSFAFAQRPARRTRARTVPFESGVSTGPLPRQRFSVSFYLTAMLFIVFDIEIIFLYPWAVIFRQLGTFGLVEMVLFAVAVLLSFIYLISNGALDWGPVKRLRPLPGTTDRTTDTTVRRIGQDTGEAA